MVKLVLGVDGGQTSTKCVLATVDGTILGVGSGGGLLHFAAQDSHERFLDSVGEAVRATFAAAGIAPRPVEAAAFGLTGVETNTPEASAARILIPQIIKANAVDVQNDAMNAFFGAHLGQPGLIIVSGTGSIGLGMGSDGRIARVGGWGWLVGDEGSAAMIGRMGASAVFHALDATGPATTLEKVLAQYFGATQTRDLKRLYYASDFGARGFAGLAPLVAQAAQAGDPVAQSIMTQAGHDLVQLVAALYRKLRFDDPKVPVALVGGAFDHLSGLRNTFLRLLSAEMPVIYIVDAALPPVLGAVIMALRLCAVSLPVAVEKLMRNPVRII